jgi:dipeptidase D
MSEIKKLQPELVWRYFSEILEIPRPSKKEEKIIAYLKQFAETNNLDFKQDKAGNILIKKPATAGKQRVKSVVFQSHVDMVCEKNSDVAHNFDTDPIPAYIDGEWLKAKGTTLGADNGIGVATQLAILADKNLEHGPIECLFTVDEETGLTGANMLEKDFFESKILINLDSEDEGEIYIGCAGGVDTLISLPLKFTKTSKNHVALKLSVTGLLGGHSGDDIDKGLGNSIKILNRILYTSHKKFEISLSDFQGGNLRNAIPREAFAIISVHKKNKDNLLEHIAASEKEIKNEFAHTEPKLNISAKPVKSVDHVLKEKSMLKLLRSIYACPNGIMAMSQTVPGLVETSTNLASVNFKKNNSAEIVTSQRSSLESDKHDTANSIESAFLLADAKVWHSDSYPGWTPNKNSEILETATKSYETLFSKEPAIKAIHAGLECGLFLEKYPHLDMISIGPTMRGVHSPDERLHIESVEKYWRFVEQIISEIPEEEAK